MSETNRHHDGSTDPAGTAGPTDVSELLGWHPDLPPGPERAIPDRLTAGMTDDEVLVHYRKTKKDPYLTSSTARALRAWDLKMGYLRRDPEPHRQPDNPEAARPRVTDIRHPNGECPGCHIVIHYAAAASHMNGCDRYSTAARNKFR